MANEKEKTDGGAKFDRGIITEVQEGDNLQYKVKSLTDKDVTSRWMEAVGAYLNEYTEDEGNDGKYAYAVDDEVYFFMFPDGRGMILGKMLR